jgi:Domain of unknown function (DUF4844)
LKQITKIIIGLIFILLTACEQVKIKTPKNAMTKFEEFKFKEKFVKDDKLFYPGIGDQNLRPILTEKINHVADDFKKIAEKGNVKEQEYQNVIKNGLNIFAEIYLQLDTEDRERICSYFEELMDIVGLESSGGYLNKFMYDFVPKNN